MKLYIDTCIWIDFFEDRKGYNDEQLGLYAYKLFLLAKKKKYILCFSSVLFFELEKRYGKEKLESMLLLFKDKIENLLITKKQWKEGKETADKRDLPLGDVMHAILSRDYHLTLISRDNDFNSLKDICHFFTPEAFIASL